MEQTLAVCALPAPSNASTRAWLSGDTFASDGQTQNEEQAHLASPGSRGDRASKQRGEYISYEAVPESVVDGLKYSGIPRQ
ncbi:hypothetical protein J0910_03590 [Nocardiopsis sp. CNT-189]|uniref:hypothetical protein n=1 Tax=Nocardiopsis oceanisediminis TaxID=2816862 RepID=UPI003B2B9765